MCAPLADARRGRALRDRRLRLHHVRETGPGDWRCPPLRAVFTVIDVGTGLGDRLFVTFVDREDKANHRVAMHLPLEHPFAALSPSDVNKNYVITLEEEL